MGCWRQIINWTSLDFFSRRSCDNHLGLISKKMPHPSVSRFNLKISYRTFHPNLPPNQIAKFMWPSWGPPGSCRSQIGPMLAPWTLLSGMSWYYPSYVNSRRCPLPGCRQLHLMAPILRVYYFPRSVVRGLGSCPNELDLDVARANQ